LSASTKKEQHPLFQFLPSKKEHPKPQFQAKQNPRRKILLKKSAASKAQEAVAGRGGGQETDQGGGLVREQVPEGVGGRIRRVPVHARSRVVVREQEKPEAEGLALAGRQAKRIEGADGTQRPPALSRRAPRVFSFPLLSRRAACLDGAGPGRQAMIGACKLVVPKVTSCLR